MNDSAPIESPAAMELEAWERLQQIIDQRDGARISQFLRDLPPEETAYTISHLEPEHRRVMLELLAEADANLAADLMEHFDDAYAAELIEDISPEAAAVIVEQMDSDEQADVLGEVEEEAATAILQQMKPEEAQDLRELLQYEPDTAGGLMITEYLAYPDHWDVSDVRRDLRANAERYNEYEVRYLYTIDSEGRLVGVVPMRSLVMALRGEPLHTAAIKTPITVRVDTPIGDLEDLFDRVDFSAVPVLDERDRLVGLVLRAAVQEARREEAEGDVLKFGGIIGGEELRSMPWNSRAVRRTAFLLPNVLLSAVSVIIILLYEPLIHRLTLLAVFLPLVANLSGAAGNQSVAVSIRELALGLVRPSDWVRICLKEAGIGLVNGLLIGALLGLVAMGLGWVSMELGWVASQQARVGLAPLAGVVVLAYILNSVVAVVVGGTIPLALKHIGVDPAMASSPILTTVTDMCSFLVTLTFAMLMLYLWAGG